MRLSSSLLIILLSFTICGCVSHAQRSVGALTLTDTQLATRSYQSRTFETVDEATVLSASTALLQDLSYQIEETEAELGVLTASRDKSAVKTEQVVLAVIGTALKSYFTPNGMGTQPTYDQKEKVHVSVVVKPQGEKSVNVRVIFQQVVTNNEGVISRNDQIKDLKIYQEFFNKLSKSLFLEAHSVT